MFKRNKFLLLSVFAHLIVIYVVAQSVMFPSIPDSPGKKPDVIQATLVFDIPLPTPEMPVEVIEEDKHQPVENKIEPITEPQTVVTSPPVLVTQPKQEEDIPQEPEQNEETNEVILTDNNIKPTPSSQMHAPVTSMARRHLNSFQQQQQNRVAEQASRYYQQHKNSPVINSKIENPFMSEEDKFRDNLKVRADCSSTSKKTAAVILGIFGGNIDCSKPPSVKGFIQNRINKQSHLPGQYRPEEPPRPQSVVIKPQP